MTELGFAAISRRRRAIFSGCTALRYLGIAVEFEDADLDERELGVWPHEQPNLRPGPTFTRGR